MNSLFIRVYFQSHYFEYTLNLGEKTFISIINNSYYVKYNNTIESNFINTNDFKLNKKYYNNEFDFYYMIGCYTNKYYVNQLKIRIEEIIYSKCKVFVDLEENFVEFDTPIYIENKLYESGKFYFSNNLSICIDIYEILIENNIVCFRQKIKYKNGNYFKFENSVKRYYNSSNDFNYKFTFNEKLQEHKENISRYIIPPTIMLIVMIIVSIFTKRLNMIMFMLASSISTLSASLIMYFKQKHRVKIQNEYITNKYKTKKSNFVKTVISDINNHYKTIDFKLLNQKELCIGYTLKNIEVEVVIVEDELKNDFEYTLNNNFKFHSKLTLNDFAIVGKYSKLFLYNLLLSIIKYNYYQNIIFIGEFPVFKFIKNAQYLQKCGRLNYKNSVIICNLKADLNYLIDNNVVIYLDIDQFSSSTIEVSSVFKHKLIKYNNSKCNENLFSLIETNLKKLYLLERKIIFDNSIKTEHLDGLRLSTDFVLDIEKEGPHGLIVGMTGSGKSVLLLQIIIQIATNYDPSGAVIGIIDFKGNALISRVEKLPHIASTFSNLSGGYENVIAAIKHELIYRQKLFSTYNVSEYSEIKNQFSLPRLFIIIDEFAELKKQLAHILEEIESIARIGRSLGVYLIISLQKVSGILSEQLKSNLNYSICLRVNSTQDSIEVINQKSAAFFKTPGEAIVKINNDFHHINIFNCLETKKQDIIINGNNMESTTYIDYEINRICKMYSKTSYVIWKNFPKVSSKLLLNFPDKKEFENFDFKYDNYIIVGNKQSGKSELIKTIIKDFKACTVYLGRNNSFISYVDMYIDSNVHIEVYINYLKLLKTKAYMIIDDFEVFNNEELLVFIEECTFLKHENIRIIISTLSIVNSLSRLVKLFNNKFMLSVNDPSESYNLFYKSYSRNNFKVGEGICMYNQSLVEFKNYVVTLSKSKEMFKISSKEVVYLSDFSRINLSNAILIYQKEPHNINKYFKAFYYKEVSDALLTKYSDKIILTNTNQFEYKFRKTKIIENMLYDFTNNETVIDLRNLDFK